MISSFVRNIQQWRRTNPKFTVVVCSQIFWKIMKNIQFTGMLCEQQIKYSLTPKDEAWTTSVIIQLNDNQFTFRRLCYFCIKNVICSFHVCIWKNKPLEYSSLKCKILRWIRYFKIKCFFWQTRSHCFCDHLANIHRTQVLFNIDLIWIRVLLH